MNVSSEKENEYQDLLDCYRSGQMTEAVMDERIRDDFQFARFILKAMKLEKEREGVRP
jgi:hypothetical protein